MTIKFIFAGTRVNHIRFNGGKSELTEFEFSPILKDGVGAGNGDINSHPESVPEPTSHILKLDFTSLS
jgi:hypothetical protein